MSSPSPEPRNPFYFLLLIAGFTFMVNAMGLTLVHVLEKWEEEGAILTPSPFRDALLRDGWKWLLGEVAVMIVFGLASMGLDRYRRWQKERAADTIPANEPPTPNRTEGTE